MTIPLNSGIKLFGWCTCFNHNPTFLVCFSGGRCSREDNRLKCFCSVCSVLWHPFKYFFLPFLQLRLLTISHHLHHQQCLLACFALPSLFSITIFFFNLRFFLPVNCFLLHCIGLLLLLIFSSFSRCHQFHLLFYSSRSDCPFHPFSFNLSMLLLSQSLNSLMFPIFPLS